MSLLKHAATGLACATLAGLAVHHFTAAPEPNPAPAPAPASRPLPASVVAPVTPPPAHSAPDPRLAELAAENAALRARLAAIETDRDSTRDQLAELRRPMTMDVISSTVRATLKPGEVAVTGGFKMPTGQRLYSFAKPTRDANGKVVVSGQLIALSEEGSRSAGIDHLSTDANNTLQHGEIWAADEFESVRAKLSSVPGTDAMSLPRLHIASGETSGFQIGDLLYKMTPTFAANGSDIDLDIRLEAPVHPAEKTPPSKK